MFFRVSNIYVPIYVYHFRSLRNDIFINMAQQSKYISLYYVTTTFEISKYIHTFNRERDSEGPEAETLLYRLSSGSLLRTKRKLTFVPRATLSRWEVWEWFLKVWNTIKLSSAEPIALGRPDPGLLAKLPISQYLWSLDGCFRQPCTLAACS